ncbi:MAG: Sjogren's syndrome/scleroderma autoantigen 1 family protein [Sulfolobales archaeon]|nr:hypothetical protein [Sulfolobales archaeon]MCX8208505.1 hypothetical protein [Sulfolobales archaeon]MDW8010626.1 Sjogren's syndrome/scleroderma autoantigen 1 family protein [Sulfolobales archaeon]
MVTKRDEVVIKKMSELLRSGAVMLDLACPLCSAPLFKLKSGEVVCPTHGVVRVVKTDAEAVEIQSQAVLDRVQALAADRISAIANSLGLESSEDAERELLDQLERWLDILERVRRLKLMAVKEEKK